jgi:hypothetical protein
MKRPTHTRLPGCRGKTPTLKTAAASSSGRPDGRRIRLAGRVSRASQQVFLRTPTPAPQEHHAGGAGQIRSSAAPGSSSPATDSLERSTPSAGMSSGTGGAGLGAAGETASPSGWRAVELGESCGMNGSSCIGRSIIHCPDISPPGRLRVPKTSSLNRQKPGCNLQPGEGRTLQHDPGSAAAFTGCRFRFLYHPNQAECLYHPGWPGLQVWKDSHRGLPHRPGSCCSRPAQPLQPTVP